MDTSHTNKQIVNREGIVGYWADLKRYTILFSQEGTYDVQYTAILQTPLPVEFQKQGMQILFSGEIYKDADLPRPMMGGQQIVWLTLTDIKAK